MARGSGSIVVAIARATLCGLLPIVWPVAVGAQAPPVPPAPRGDGEADLEPRSTEERAQVLFHEGLQRVREERLDEAVATFERSVKLSARPSALYNLALALHRLGRYLEARRAIDGLLQDASAPGFEKFRERAQTLHRRAGEQLAGLGLHVTPADAVVAVDGDALAGGGPERSVELDPGRHRVAVRRAGYVEQTFDVVLAPRERQTRAVVLSEGKRSVQPVAAATADGPAQPPLAGTAPGTREGAYWLMGGGGVLLLAAGVTGLLALDAEGRFEDACPLTRDCDPSLRGLGDEVEALGLATDLLLAGGALLTASGLTWLVWPRDGDVGVEVAVGAVTLHGRF